ncbi:MAG: glycosyl transferase family 2 [Rickettsiales bacterium]|jgi:glycosyltransferase involved in cell wall biosynthesis|nr:glycosyl transferase family 2 [Rickettsiales bacterium]
MPRSILLVTSDFAGLTKNGGIGTAFYHLALLLASHKYNVTVLYTHGSWVEQGDKSFENWQSEYQEQGITVIPLPFKAKDDGLSSTVSTSLRICEWIKEHERFDCIHFHDWQGLGFFTLLAKQQGMLSRNTPIIIQSHSPTFWHRLNNGDPIDSVELLQINYMERMAVAYADHIISPSAYMLRWYQEQGWETKAEQHVIPNNLSLNANSHVASSTSQPITNIVFFGRQELRKGLGIFCDAIEMLAYESPELLTGQKITFLGKASTVHNEVSTHYIAQRMKHIDVPFDIQGNFNTHEAIAYLQTPGTLAVVASLLENSPYVVMEVLAYGIPAIVSASGGTEELIAPESPAITFQPNAEALAARLKETLTRGAMCGTLAHSLDEIKAKWLDFHNVIPQATSNNAAATFNSKALVKHTPLGDSTQAPDALFFDTELRKIFTEGLLKRMLNLSLVNEGLGQENMTLRRALSETLHSTSWKVTKPLRVLKKWVG